MIDKDFLTTVFDGVESADERIEKVMKEYESDVTGLKVNKDKVLEEKKALETKFKELETGSLSLKETIKQLEEKAGSSGSEADKAFFEAEKKKLEDMYKAQTNELSASVQKRETEYNALYEKYCDSYKTAEFDKALDGMAVNPAMRGILRTAFFAAHNFGWTKVEGDDKFLDKDYKTLKDALKTYLTTDEGKLFIVNNNSGGGAASGKGVKNPLRNPFAKETLNLSEQGRMIRENPTLAAQMKAMAEAS
jgi:chromosome segregation ATPase